MEFEWDPVKAAANLGKHGVSFEDAKRAFADPNRREFFKPQRGEDRFILIGESGDHLLAIAYVERGANIRIISARKAAKDERKAYQRKRT